MTQLASINVLKSDWQEETVGLYTMKSLKVSLDGSELPETMLPPIPLKDRVFEEGGI
jgi:hypothetical protein